MTAPRRKRPRWVRVLVVLTLGAAAVVAAFMAFSVWLYSGVTRGSSWSADVPSSQVVEFARVQPPERASELRWAYLNGFQDDLAVLSFRLLPGEEEGFLAGIGVAVKPTVGTYFAEPALRGFQRAGAPDLKTAGALREGEFLAEPLPGHSKRLAATVWLAAEADGGTRVWVYAMDAP